MVLPNLQIFQSGAYDEVSVSPWREHAKDALLLVYQANFEVVQIRALELFSELMELSALFLLSYVGLRHGDWMPEEKWEECRSAGGEQDQGAAEVRGTAAGLCIE